MEFGHKGVRVNAVFPGGVNTIMTNTEKKPVEEINWDYQQQPIQRIGEAGEIGQATLFLVSDDASYLCGAELAVDGGMTLGGYRDYLPGASNSLPQ